MLSLIMSFTTKHNHEVYSSNNTWPIVIFKYVAVCTDVLNLHCFE